jgi:N-acetylglucosaminyldiphosphoundecaprenol N-acetyl-beta-D-mannosaminyltransferase
LPGHRPQASPTSVTARDAVRFLGVSLAPLTAREAADRALWGGLILAPSAPGLCDLSSDPEYRAALLAADINLPDSGLAILLARLLRLGSLPRTSGLGFLKELLARAPLREPGATFWVMPSEKAQRLNIEWLRTQGIEVTLRDCYIAPVYPRKGIVQDEVLLEILMQRLPRSVFICTGSGSQEKLGAWLRGKLPPSTSLNCIGAAIGFLSGDQVRIPAWADRACLGWLIRSLAHPARFIPRYLRALRLIPLAVRNRDRLPPLSA